MRVASGHYRSGVEVLMTVVPSVEKGAAPEGLSAADCGSRTRVADASKIRYVLQKTNPQLPDLASQFADIRSLVDSGDSTVGKPVTMLVSRLFSKHATPVSPTGDGRVDLDLGQADTTEADEVGIPDTTQTRVGCITNERIWSIENGELCIRFPYEGRDLTGADISAILAAKGIAGTNFQAAAVVEAPSQHVALKEDLNRRRGSGSVSSGEPAEARIVALLDAAYWWKGKLKQIMSLRFPNADVISKAAGSSYLRGWRQELRHYEPAGSMHVTYFRDVPGLAEGAIAYYSGPYNRLPCCWKALYGFRAATVPPQTITDVVTVLDPRRTVVGEVVWMEGKMEVMVGSRVYSLSPHKHPVSSRCVRQQTLSRAADAALRKARCYGGLLDKLRGRRCACIDGRNNQVHLCKVVDLEHLRFRLISRVAPTQIEALADFDGLGRVLLVRHHGKAKDLPTSWLDSFLRLYDDDSLFVYSLVSDGDVVEVLDVGGDTYVRDHTTGDFCCLPRPREN